MGTQYPTCCVSNLPILEGEKAVQILLLPGRTHPSREEVFPTLGSYEGSSHGPTSFYLPFLWPIKGTHNGYGGLWPASKGEPEPTVAAPNLFQSLLFERLSHTEEEIPKQDTATYVPLGPMALGDFLKRRAYFHYPVKITTGHMGVTSLYSTLVRHDIWTALLATEDFGIHEGCRQYLEELPAKIAPELGLRRMGDLEMSSNPFIHAGNELSIRSLDHTFREAPRQDAEEAARALADLCHVNLHLDSLRRHWQPMTGAGSQDLNFRDHVRFADLVAKVARGVQRDMDEF